MPLALNRMYIAGPMRGYDLCNFPSFDKVKRQMTREGWDVASPADHDRDSGFDPTINSIDGFDFEAALKWDIDMVFQCDAIYMLKDWESSVGANIEHSIASFLGKRIMYQTPKNELQYVYSRSNALPKR